MPISAAHARLDQPGGRFETGEETIRGVRLKVWKNAPQTLRDVFNATAQFKNETALVYEDERISYGAFRTAVAALSRQLMQDGVREGDRIAIAMRNLPEWPIAFWAAVLCGAIAVPLNAWWTGAELAPALQDCGARILIADGERLERLLPLIGQRDIRIYTARATPPGASATPLERIIGSPANCHRLTEAVFPEAPLEPDGDATIFYTSGTTGSPKGVVSSHRNIIANIWNGANAEARGYLRAGQEPPCSTDARRSAHLMTAPFFHVIGCFANMIPHMMEGSKIVLMRRWDADSALPLIERERINSIFGVPTIALQILQHPRIAEFDLTSLVSIGYGGAPAPVNLAEMIASALPHVRVTQGWGMTETSGTAITNPDLDYQRKPESCGVPSMTGEVKITDAHGQALPRGDIGELWYKGSIVARGYWNKPQETAVTFIDGWVRTGDVARLDEEGFVYIVDRLKDVVIRGGENIYCIEIENALYAHPAVDEAAVIGIAHPTLGEEPAAIIHLKTGAKLSEDDLRAHLAPRLAAYKTPSRFVILTEPLPRGPAGKILKNELKAMLAEAQSKER
ncbi:MAG: class I adenylate-forming enzyme family protein [Caulobacterales bacterium]